MPRGQPQWGLVGSAGGRARLVMAAAGLLCGLVLLAAGLSSLEGFARSGSRSYGMIAENLVAAGIYSLDGSAPTAMRPPAYPLLLALAELLGGADRLVAWALLLQGAIAAAALALTALIAHRLFQSPIAAALSAALVAANLPLQQEAFVMRETGLFVLLTLLFVFLTLAAHRPWLRAVLLAIVSAAGMLTRPGGIVFLPVAALVLIYLSGPAPSRALRALAIYALTLCLCLAPWQIYLHSSFGIASLAGTSTGGMNLFKGNHPMMGEIYNLADVDWVDPLLQGLLQQAGIDPGAEEWRADAHLRDLAVQSIAADPARFVRRTAEKAMAFLSPANVPVGRAGGVELEGGTLVVQKPAVIVGNLRSVYHLFVIPLGILGIAGALLLPGRRLWGLCAGALIAANVLLYAVTFPEKRYRYPLEPILAIATVGVLRRYFSPGAVAFERAEAGVPLPDAS